MKEVKKGVMDILLYGIVFVVVQLIVSFLGMLVWSFVQHEELADVRTAMLSGHNPVLLALTSVFSSVITLVVFLKTKWTPISRNYLLSKPWLTLLWVALFALGAMIPLEFVYEQIGLEMDDTTKPHIRRAAQRALGVCGCRHPGTIDRGGCLPWRHPPYLAGYDEQAQPLGCYHDFGCHFWCCAWQCSPVCQCPVHGSSLRMDVLSHP